VAIGAYGETVAAYRYLVLAEKSADPRYRRTFAAMADEEQSHKQRLQKLFQEMFPDTDFFLTPEDKEMVISGPRLLNLSEEFAIEDAMKMVLKTERKTAKFYAQHGRNLPDGKLQALFHELAEEGAEHYQRLRNLAREVGVTPPQDE